MKNEIPYLPSYKNVGALFQKMKSAKIPDAFTHKFLSHTIGLKSTADRALISLLRSLGFLDTTSKPTERYKLYKNDTASRKVMADAIKEAYRDLYAANENIHVLGNEEMKGIVSQVSGGDSAQVSKILGTFKALVPLADFSYNSDKEEEERDEVFADKLAVAPSNDGFTTDFHFNIQVHLPSNCSEETYLNIFSAIRKVFK